MSDKPSISVLTASTRPDGLPMLADCLAAQTLREFEWLICVPSNTQAPADLVQYLRDRVPGVRFLQDPPRRPDDFYRLNGAWNTLVRAAQAPLLLFACDWIHFQTDALRLFWDTFLEHPNAIVSSWCSHYRRVVNNRPEVLWHEDDRLAHVGDDAVMKPIWTEFSLCAVPRAPLVAAGGLEEQYDQVAGNSEKELAMRMAKAGSACYLAWGIEHRVFSHEKESSTKEWDQKYKEACALLAKHAQEIETGHRLTVPYLDGA